MTCDTTSSKRQRVYKLFIPLREQMYITKIKQASAKQKQVDLKVIENANLKN